MKNFTRLMVLVFSVVMLASFAVADVEVHVAAGSSTDQDGNYEAVAGLENGAGTKGDLNYFTTSLIVPSGSPFARGWTAYSNGSMGRVNPFPSFSWTTLDNPTSLSLEDDEMSSAINLGFNTLFYGNSYSQMRVCSNGFVTFDDTTLCPYVAQSVPSSTSPNNLVVGWWEDLLPASAGGGGTIKYQAFGSSPNRKMVVEFNEVAHFNDLNDVVYFQIVLKEN